MRRKRATWTGFALLAAIAAAWMMVPVATHAQCGVTWTNATEIPSGNFLRSVAYGGGKFVAVGDKGTVMWSTDGVYWTLVNVGSAANLWGVTYGGGRFVIVGDGIIFNSTDGVQWNPIPATPYGNLRDVAYGDGKYVAVGLNASIITSSDATTWAQPYWSGPDLHGIHYDGGKFVAVGIWGVTAISTDGGDTFTVYPATVSTTLWGITYGEGLWVMVGENGDAFTSPDGMVWSLVDTHTGNHLYDVTYTGGLFVAVGKTGTIRHSENGTLWNVAYSPTQVDLHGICYGTDRFMAVGMSATLRNLCVIGHSISGIVTTEGGSGIQGVQVTLSGAGTAVERTESDGTFTFTGLADGTYTVTPSNAGFTFNPPSLTVPLSGQDVAGLSFVQIQAVTPPSITSVLKATNPFRLKVYGSNFHPGCAVRVNGTEVTTVYKSASYLMAKNVKTLIPKGATVQITVINKDDGGISSPVSFTR